MVEQKTLYTAILRLTVKHADLLAQAAIKGMKALKDKIETIAFCYGLEFSEHEKIARPYASWGRRINENINGLMRRYFSRATDFNLVSD